MRYSSKSLEPELSLPYTEPQVAKKKLYLNTHPHTFMSESFQRSLFPEPQVKHQYSMCSYTLVATSACCAYLIRGDSIPVLYMLVVQTKVLKLELLQ